MATVALIPARYASTRFPGKPLAEIDGEPMIVRVARRVKSAKLVDEVAVATDDDRIRSAVESAGLRAVMTPVDCVSGTDRVAVAYEAMAGESADGGDLVINVQGDEPLIDPDDVDRLVEAMIDAHQGIGTLARPCSSREAFLSPHVVKVVCGVDDTALYFSRAPIPHNAVEPLQHLGVYAYRAGVLAAIMRLEPTELERAESLEQLRWLEHGHLIRVVRAVSPRASVAVDVPADLDRVLEILRSERS